MSAWNDKEVPHLSAQTRDAAHQSLWRLTALSTIECELFGLLPQLSSHRFSARWMLATRSRGDVDAMRLTLLIRGESVPIYLCDDRWIDRWARHWRQSESAMQQAVMWQLRGTRVWHALEAVFGATVTIAAAVVERVPADWLRLTIRIGRLSLGCWCEAESCVRVLAMKKLSKPPVLSRLSNLRIRCQLALQAIAISDDEYAGLEVGDCLLLADSIDDVLPGMLVPVGSKVQRAVQFNREGTMTIEGNFISLDEHQSLTVAEEHRVELSIELGTSEFTLGALANLQAGECIRLNRALDDLSVTVRHQGQKIAVGHLVEISGLLGVCLDDVTLGRAT